MAECKKGASLKGSSIRRQRSQRCKAVSVRITLKPMMYHNVLFLMENRAKTGGLGVRTTHSTFTQESRVHKITTQVQCPN